MSDGGIIHLDFKGEFSTKPSSNKLRDVCILVPGLLGNNQKMYVISSVRTLFRGDPLDDDEGYDVVLINYRGFGGIKLNTPKFANGHSGKDFYEAIKYIVETYCRP